MIWIELHNGEILAVQFEEADDLVAVQDVPADFLLVDTKATYYYNNGEIIPK